MKAAQIERRSRRVNKQDRMADLGLARLPGIETVGTFDLPFIHEAEREVESGSLKNQAVLPDSRPLGGNKRLKDKLRNWTRVLEKLNQQKPMGELLSAFQGTRREAMREISKLGLSHYPFVSVSVDEFLKDPDRYLSKIPGQQYFWAIQPRSGDVRYEFPSQCGGTKEELLKQAEKYAAYKQKVEYILTINEQVDVKYVGNIVVNQEGRVYAEFVAAPYSPTRSGVEKVYRASQDPHLGSFFYSFKEERLRSAIQNGIHSIPHVGRGRQAIYRPGYYEVMLAKKQSGQGLRVGFFDIKDSTTSFCFDM